MGYLADEKPALFVSVMSGQDFSDVNIVRKLIMAAQRNRLLVVSVMIIMNSVSTQRFVKLSDSERLGLTD